MKNSLYPACVRIDYTSEYGTHAMTLPTVPILDGPAGGAGNQFQLRGLELPTDCDAAIKDLVNILKGGFKTTTNFLAYTLFKFATPTSPAQPIASAPLNIAGTNTSTSWSKASQFTMTWRTETFGIFKLVLLDIPMFDNWAKDITVGASGFTHDVNAYVTADASFLAGRDGGKPQTFLQTSKTLNEKLRRSYKLN